MLDEQITSTRCAPGPAPVLQGRRERRQIVSETRCVRAAGPACASRDIARRAAHPPQGSPARGGFCGTRARLTPQAVRRQTAACAHTAAPGPAPPAHATAAAAVIPPYRRAGTPPLASGQPLARLRLCGTPTAKLRTHGADALRTAPARTNGRARAVCLAPANQRGAGDPAGRRRCSAHPRRTVRVTAHSLLGGGQAGWRRSPPEPVPRPRAFVPLVAAMRRRSFVCPPCAYLATRPERAVLDGTLPAASASASPASITQPRTQGLHPAACFSAQPIARRAAIGFALAGCEFGVAGRGRGLGRRCRT
ncbi:hypothetical protein PsYK624_049580 [Phanerochaete sordida]|uniref:Uncharacterized protein n=1 Tax=Phanerochaete sordida TaxID=48140 RepID=A0A9P3LAW8_9APHY|nr:hypothetical protein PsYK624_049580 [Phanerochaete sordida]